MEQSQLVELIRTLNSEEKVRFQHFFASPLFNNGRMRAQVILLLEFCLDYSWDNTEQNFEKKQVYTTVFPNQTFIEGKLEKVMVEALKVVRSFLIAQRYFRKENEFHHRLDFADEIRSRGLEIRYQQLVTRIQKIQDNAPQNAQYFHQQYLLEYSKCEDESIRNQAKGDLNIPNTIHALEADFHLNRLILLNQLLLQKKITHLDIPDDIQVLIDNVQIPDRYLSESPYLKISHEVFILLKKKHPSSTEVQLLFDLLLSNEHKLEPKSLSDFYTFLRNFCVLSISADYEHIELEYMLHKLYKDSLSRGYLHFEGKINRSRYLAVAINALNIKEFDWALEFIEKYKHELRDENETQDIYRLNLANHLFYVGRFSECLDNIPSATPFVDYLMVGKRLELKALYELRSDLLPYKFDAFKMFLSRTSQKLLSEHLRQIHSDFANLLYQLIYSKPGDPKRSEVLIKRIHEKKQAAEWRWLMEKAKALKPNQTHDAMDNSV